MGAQTLSPETKLAAMLFGTAIEQAALAGDYAEQTTYSRAMVKVAMTLHGADRTAFMVSVKEWREMTREDAAKQSHCDMTWVDVHHPAGTYSVLVCETPGCKHAREY